MTLYRETYRRAQLSKQHSYRIRPLLDEYGWCYTRGYSTDLVRQSSCLASSEAIWKPVKGGLERASTVGKTWQAPSSELRELSREKSWIPEETPPSKLISTLGQGSDGSPFPQAPRRATSKLWSSEMGTLNATLVWEFRRPWRT